ncbi:MAG TPA: glutamate--tRNA ligase [Candidatus Paceibacterota bacterium]|nr:glutamate--tRNA ligase [Candidatus Paceibacterota bacterium]
MHSTDRVVTRFAPSPTGNLHSGSYRTAIFCYLFARKHGGKFILRIEDTDRERSKKEYENNILESLAWLGLEHDALYHQSEHVERHREVLERLVAEGKAYISTEEAKDGSGETKEIVRFKNPNEIVSFKDEIKGTVTMDTTDLGDFVIGKSITEPLYNFAVVVDDFDEGVTHVIRGEDHVSNTPRQILIQRAIGASTPVYAHLPLVLGMDKQKLSKRKGALAMTEYRDLGYLPEALLNMVAMIGWNPGTEQELFSKDELIAAFDLNKVQSSPASFNPEKLDWFNREYMKKLDSAMFWQHATPWTPKGLDHAMAHKIEHLIRDRINKFSDIKTLFEAGEFDYFFAEPIVDHAMLPWKGDNLETACANLGEVRTRLEQLPQTDWTYDSIKSVIWEYAEATGRGNVLWPFRVALSGRDKSPDPFEIASIIGKEKTLARLAAAVA